MFALLATALWSGNFIVARDLSETIPPVSLAFWRWVIALLVLTPFALRQFMRDWPFLKKKMGYLLVTSFFGVTAFNTLLYMAGRTTSALNLSLISISFPIFIIIISRFYYKEKITLAKVLGIILVFLGVSLIITKGSLAVLLELSFSMGDIWMLVAAIIFAVYSILLKQKPKEVGLYSFQFTTFTLGLLMLLPFYLLETTFVPEVHYDTNTILSLVYVGIAASLLAYVFWNKAVLLIGPTKSGMVYYTLPLFSGVLAFFILNESLGINHLYSAILIFSGILISTKNKGEV